MIQFVEGRLEQFNLHIEVHPNRPVEADETGVNDRLSVFRSGRIGRAAEIDGVFGYKFPVPHTGEQPPVEDKGPPQGVSLDSFAGPVHVEWDTEAALTPLGQLPFFIDFLKAAGLCDAFIADCPLRYTSPNAPKKRDVLEQQCCRCCLGTSVMLT